MMIIFLKRRINCIKLQLSFWNRLVPVAKPKIRVLKKLDHAEKELEKTPQKTVSLTDPESRWMKNKKNRMELSYNMQIAADYDSGIILTSTITQDPTDHHQLITTNRRDTRNNRTFTKLYKD